MLNKVEILQQAFGLIGKNFNALSELGPAGTWASTYYDITVKAILEDDYWPFANARRELNQLTETPLTDEWKYIYQLPSDYLTANYVVDSLNYYIYEDKLYSNNKSVVLDYRFMPNNARFRADFILYLVYELASALAVNAQATDVYINALAKKAETLRLKAASSSAKAQPNRRIRSMPYDEVRGS